MDAELKATKFEGRVDPAPSSPLVTVAIAPRDFEAKIVTDSELQSLGFTSAASVLFVAMFGVAFGATVSLWITIGTVPTLTPNQYAGYLSGLLVSIMASITFAGLTVLTLIWTKREKTRIATESANRSAKLFGSIPMLSE